MAAFFLGFVMEACLPELFWSGRICYRRNPFLQTDDSHEGVYEEDEQAFDENVCEDPEDLASLNIQQLANGNFKSTFHVPNAYYGVVIGKKGLTKQRLERETKTEIQIPKHGNSGNEITVSGSSRTGVGSACNRIQMIVQSARARQPFTHFVSIPMNTPGLKKSFLNFKREVLHVCKDARGIDDSLFQDPSLLHLTVCTLPLMDEVERQNASGILEDFKQIIQRELLVSGELTLEVKGLEIMNDDKAEVDVLYAKVKPAESKDDHKLQMICDQIMMRLVEANLAQRQYDRVKLHLTVMNSLFRNDPSVLPGSSNFEESKRETFDCRPIFDHFANYNFGRVNMTEIHLSQRGSSRRKEGEYYIPSWVVKMNSEC